MERVPVLDEGCCLDGVALGGGVLAQAGCVAKQAAVLASSGEGWQVAWGGEATCRPPEFCRGYVTPTGATAVLLKVVRQPVNRPGGRDGAADGAGTDAGQRTSDAPARGGGVGEGLFQPVLAEPVPVGVGQVAGRGRFQES